MKKKNLFKVKYVRVYLMLNAVCLKTFDYKSIALPAELQGHNLICRIFSLISQLNQSIINKDLARCFVKQLAIIAPCSGFVSNLSVWPSVRRSETNQDFITSFNFIKTIKTWSGIYEKEQEQINQVYKS